MKKGSQGSGGAPKVKGSKMRTETQGSNTSGRAGAPIDPRVQAEIGKHLRAIYDDVINEPVPAKFMELLEKLEQSTTRKN
jgi:hypothetical protein